MTKARDVVAEWYSVPEDAVVRMTAAVQQALDEEREACARVCDDHRDATVKLALKVYSQFREAMLNGQASGAQKCARLIRARGDNK